MYLIETKAAGELSCKHMKCNSAQSGPKLGGCLSARTWKLKTSSGAEKPEGDFFKTTYTGAVFLLRDSLWKRASCPSLSSTWCPWKTVKPAKFPPTAASVLRALTSHRNQQTRLWGQKKLLTVLLGKGNNLQLLRRDGTRQSKRIMSVKKPALKRVVSSEKETWGRKDGALLKHKWGNEHSMLRNNYKEKNQWDK